MLSRRMRAPVAQFLLTALLFSQAALAIATCEMPRTGLAQSIALQEAQPSCHEEPVRNANLCAAHCLGADQSADTPQVAIPDWGGAAVLVVGGEDRWGAPVALLQHRRPSSAGPHLRILFQSFLI